MSSFYLCEMCANKVARADWPDGTIIAFSCRAHGCRPVRPMVMVDRHGRGGVRYDEPRSVCRDYEPRGEP